ncbi:MAG: AAA family ATPase [Deltaproteobacteria bacterium]|jgi:hypothetical protein|nr:AAA family ATPase [Deltaproteobacteria bacterium]
MKRLPIGITDFSEIIRGDYLYADKTELIYEMVTSFTPFYLGRPDGFGKTLLLSTLEAIFQGRRDLFEGLWIADSDYDWLPRPFIRVNMAGLDTSDGNAFDKSLFSRFKAIAEPEGIKLEKRFIGFALEGLARGLQKKYNSRVAIIIEEYNAPGLNKITDNEVRRRIFGTLDHIYSIIKGMLSKDFFLITGPGEYDPESSGTYVLDLNDLTMQPDFLPILGFTTEEFDALFGDRLPATLTALKAKGQLPPEATELDLRQRILSKAQRFDCYSDLAVLNSRSVLDLFHRETLDEF